MKSQATQSKISPNSKKLSPTRVNKILASRYKNLLQHYVKQICSITDANLFGMLDNVGKQLAVKNDANDDLTNAFNKTEAQSDTVYESIKPKVRNILYQMFLSHEAKFSKNVQKKIGVNILPAFKSKADKDAFDFTVSQNFDLIKSLTSRQLFTVKNIIYAGLRSSAFDAGKIRDKVRDQFGITKRHANFIARDQSHKFYSTLTEVKCGQLGADKYIWHNSGDRRVRGNPAGLYPNAKHNHWTREGKVYYFNKPPAGGNPGQDYDCRCYAEPILPSDYDELINERRKQSRK